MVKASRSKGRECIPRPSDGPCKLAPRRKPKNTPILLNKACPVCKMWRCPAHCDCGPKRQGRRAGCGANAGLTSEVKVDTSAEPVAESVSVPATSNRPLKLDVKTFGPTGTLWKDNAVKDLKKSSDVCLPLGINMYM